jgi:hypothetical protein
LVPNLNKEEKRIPISSVVLGSQRVAMTDALYNVARKKVDGEAANPLVQDGQKLVPSVTRVFSQARQIYVYLQAYEQSATTVEPLIAFVALYSGQKKIFETQPVEVTSAGNNRLKTIPVTFSVNLNKIPPGKYDCQVSVLDHTGQKVAFWRAPIAVVPSS